MAMATNQKSLKEGRNFSEAASGATTDESPEAWCSAERISGGEGLFSGLGQHGITISYNRLLGGRHKEGKSR